MEHIHIKKRKEGHTEPYDHHKVRTSCSRACGNAEVAPDELEKICNDVTDEISKWVKEKKSVSTNDIFKEVAKVLAKHDKNASFMYETHRDVS